MFCDFQDLITLEKYFIIFSAIFDDTFYERPLLNIWKQDLKKTWLKGIL